MDLQSVWTVSLKEFKIFLKRPTIIYTTVVPPILLGIALPLYLGHAVARSAIETMASSGRIDGFLFFLAALAVTLPTTIASYSLVGEKIQKTLEPLLATPVSDGEILLGKFVSAILPPILAVYAGATIFMALIDQSTYSVLGYLFFPNWNAALILLVLAPLGSVSAVELNVILSARMNDPRAVQQLGAILVLPFLGIFVAALDGYISVDTSSLLVICAIVFAAAVALFYLSKAAFRREEILTRWK